MVKIKKTYEINGRKSNEILKAQTKQKYKKEEWKKLHKTIIHAMNYKSFAFKQ